MHRQCFSDACCRCRSLLPRGDLNSFSGTAVLKVCCTFLRSESLLLSVLHCPAKAPQPFHRVTSSPLLPMDSIKPCSTFTQAPISASPGRSITATKVMTENQFCVTPSSMLIHCKRKPHSRSCHPLGAVKTVYCHSQPFARLVITCCLLSTFSPKYSPLSPSLPPFQTILLSSLYQKVTLWISSDCEGYE